MSFPVIDRKDEHELLGFFFFIREPKTKKPFFQGRIVSRIDKYGYFEVDIYNWLDGGRSFSRVVSMDEIHKHFFLTTKDPEIHSDMCQQIFKYQSLSLTPFFWEEE